MNKKLIAVFSLLVILTFIGYIIVDTVKSGSSMPSETTAEEEIEYPDMWNVTKEITVTDGSLKAVTVSDIGEVFAGGNAFVSCYDTAMTKKWSVRTPSSVTALAIDGDTLYAASAETIFLIGTDGKIITEWGPYEANSFITSVSVYGDHVAFADAGIKRIFILEKDGQVSAMIGHADASLIIPSPYFDVALGAGNLLYLANTGNRRIETWTTGGKYLDAFGEAGTAPDAFCGCCNPAHFIIVPQGFITAEKGINRIKILDKSGSFVEYVSARNDFTPGVPLDIASSDGITIYAADSEDSRLYVFRRNR
ncbi:MAG: PQQ-binding-like beta-propeller repeat protein [Bacteroidales bacterium]|nr:PQQ-binding-like beta-propeller repeat protein [Bacteroidales bacterium]MBN2632080.1 PQQ-binding-like beta-propeller repeat protein [Bacteroidales bacterium]